MEDLNPLDWTAVPFLSLYVMVAGGVLILLMAWQTRLGTPLQGGEAAGGLEVLPMAYLAGGAERAATVALVGLVEAGAAWPDRQRRVVRFDSTAPVPTELQPYRHVTGGEATRDGFQAQFTARWERMHRTLADQGLVPGDAEVTRFRYQGAAALCLPLLLGVAKVLVGESRGRPVGILAMLLILTAVCGVMILSQRPHCTLAGRAALRAAQDWYERAVRAPLPHEMALAVALSGMAVLAGRDYRWALARNSSSTGGDGGGDGGGGDGGGGCGGCSG